MRSQAAVVRRRRSRRRIQNQEQSRRSAQALAGVAVLLALVVVLVVGGGAALAVGVYIYYARDLPNPDEIVKAKQQFETTLIYDRGGKTVLYQVIDPAGGDRRSVPLSEIPANLINATIAIEDKSFYENPGFDVRGIIRSVWIVAQGGLVQGGSTITQQLIKNILIDPKERTSLTFDRKIKEIILANEISRRYSKDQILEWYLNNNFYGNLAYGIDTAAKVYFGKPVRDLTLGEAAMLAAIPQNPQLNPLDSPLAARQRQAVVLDSMVSYGYITRDQATEAASQVIVTQPVTERFGLIAPHFSLYARRQAEQLLNAQGLDGGRLVLQDGLRIYTTLDVDLQYQAECVTRAYITRVQGGDQTAAPNTTNGKPCDAAQYLITPPRFKLGTQRNVTNAAALVIKPSTGEILSMIGSLDYWNAGIDGNFNAALGLRQPGSAFKPFTYVTAFASKKYTPATMLLDIPTTFNPNSSTPYTPRNEDEQFHGPVSVREALANSYNIPAVQVLANVGIGQVIRRAHQLGINSINGSLDQYGLALTLGSGEVSLLDLTYAYTVFANLGTLAGTPVDNPRSGFRAYDPIAVLRIEDKDGKILWQLDDSRNTFGKQNVLDSSLAYLINNILSDNEARLPAFGRGNALELSRPAAVKTGTTNDNRDAWTVGYTPQLVTGVWVGNNNNAPMSPDVSGGTGAAPIWHAIMEYAHFKDSLPVQDWPRPPTIIEVPVCKKSGLLPTPNCDKVRELFYADATTSTVPTQPDIYWKRIQINSRNGLIATAATPADLVTERIYFDYPPEAREWARTVGLPLPPTEYDTGGARPAENIASITAPVGLARVRGTVEIKGNIDSPDVVSYNLAYGAGINPTQWVSIGGSDPKVRGQDITLGRWDTNGLDGLYTLRLSVVLKDNVLQPYTLQLTVDNRPPTLRVVSPAAGATIGPNDKTIKLEVEAADNFEVAYVEFYRNGQLIDTVKSAPFSTEWKIDQGGPQTFSMTVYDSAGNSTQSDPIRVNVTRSN
ncbi:MAG: transglycosylase domain-containing protein [Anaerolineae bacterium]|nr:transglycosylase domain-containing protein [Anaerolineae bacterium]